MEPLEDDLEKVFNICDTDGDGLLTKAELEHILQDIGVEQEDIDEFMRGLEAAEINFAMFTDAIEKFRSMGDHSSRFIQSVNSNRSLAGSANSGVSLIKKYHISHKIHNF
jgi:Ca2+-binding EF-hand superfamily protein